MIKKTGKKKHSNQIEYFEALGRFVYIYIYIYSCLARARLSFSFPSFLTSSGQTLIGGLILKLFKPLGRLLVATQIELVDHPRPGWIFL